MKAAIVFFTLAAITGAQAFAHGDAHQKKATTAAAPAKVEQKAFGVAGDPKKISRTIAIEMSDAMRFTPADIHVKQGETIRFTVKNNGKMMHEMVIGAMDDLKAHADLMKKFPDMEHDEPYMAHVPAGKSHEIVWQFNRPGEFNIACLIPGHFEAGMVGKIAVK